ncbi:MAG: putative hydroxymethylpyrimidine transporter CytX [Neisseria sp.]|uniref:putative hydroxymethylpyrimidine transporter CytX n=1 Tax=Neisseria sp. TaxID=192066 RepID=UPI0026DC733E|nr:putative hydroxymethylpyrimidine transporter CytX [Neisseria sp.]MDO4640959.1 putative hydroxymethylpyrimidine transporter CytX [Neisseria sp.]
MQTQKLSAKASGLIWFGAAVSVTEIMTGTLFAPLGWSQGLAAIFIGHLIGCLLFYCAGLIGAQTGRSAMQTVQLSFGKNGSLLFSAANILQLVGWTAIMIFTGAQIASALTQHLWGNGSEPVWNIIIGGLIILWLITGVRHFSRMQTLMLGALFITTLWLSGQVFSGSQTITAPANHENMAFGLAVELSAIMPLSWLPLVSDYTRHAESPRKTTLAATLAYFLTSSWMYALGLAAALFTSQTDIAQILLHSGLGIAGILIVVLSTVTTTFLDAYSAGVSANTLHPRFKENTVAIIITIIGTILAATLPVDRFENFLLFIGSVFSPMIAIQIADYFVLKRRAQSHTDWLNLSLWLAGFLLYRALLNWPTPLGSTLPVMVATFLLTIAIRKALAIQTANA